MRVAILIGIKDLKLRLRDRSAIIVGFFAPLLIATIISFAFGNDEVFQPRLAIANEDGGPIATEFIMGMESQDSFPSLTLKTTESRQEAVDLLEMGEAGAALVFTSGFSDAVAQGEEVEIEVIRGTEGFFDAELATAIAEGLASELNSGRLAVQTSLAAGALNQPGSSLEGLIERSISGRIPVSVADGSVSAREVSSSSYFSPAMTIFFLFFTVQFGALGIITERKQGTLNRLLGSPTRPAYVVIGKVLSAFVLGLLSFGVMILATTNLLGADWGDPLAVAVLVVTMTFAVMGITGLAVALGKTEEQAAGFASIVGIIFALLGGNFLPIHEAPEIIQRISLITPNGWALRGFSELASTGGGIELILPNIAAIVAFGLITGALGLLLGRRMVAV